jgi:hypothetical protein
MNYTAPLFLPVPFPPLLPLSLSPSHILPPPSSLSTSVSMSSSSDILPMNGYRNSHHSQLSDFPLSDFPSITGTFSISSESNNSSGFNLGSFSSNSTSLYPKGGDHLLPHEFTDMTARSRNEVVAYSILFIIAATGNLTVFFSVYRQLTKLKWRITVLMLHLSIADLIVTFFLMPLEIFWRITIQWIGGESLCKICQFFRAFGLYLSSNILICISLDRFIAILFPLRMVGATRRVKTMIAIAWLAAALSAAPQVRMFIWFLFSLVSLMCS